MQIRGEPLVEFVPYENSILGAVAQQYFCLRLGKSRQYVCILSDLNTWYMNEANIFIYVYVYGQRACHKNWFYLEISLYIGSSLQQLKMWMNVLKRRPCVDYR